MTHEEAFQPLDSAIWEMGEAFRGLEDRDVWRRAHPSLLSVGELAAHVADGEAASFIPDFDSPLVTEAAGYYPKTLAQPLRLDMGAEALYSEVKRVHEACKERFLRERPELSSLNPSRQEWTWAYTLEYAAFHAAYHTGQMYSVRHLMGHQTADN